MSIIIDKSIYNRAPKKELPALKRGFYIKGAEERGESAAMYRKALTKQGSNKMGVKPQHIDMEDKKAQEPPK